MAMGGPTRCPVCSSPNDLKRCTGCGSVWYCSRSCQRSHWKEHKDICRALGPPAPLPPLPLARADLRAGPLWYNLGRDTIMWSQENGNKWPENSSEHAMLLDASVFAEHFFTGTTVVRVNTQGFESQERLSIQSSAALQRSQRLTRSPRLSSRRCEWRCTSGTSPWSERFGFGVATTWINSPVQTPSSGRGSTVGECPLLPCRLSSCMSPMTLTQLSTSLAPQ